MMKIRFLAALLVGIVSQNCCATSSETCGLSESYSAAVVDRLVSEHTGGLRAIDIEFTKVYKESTEVPQMPVISYKFCDEGLVRFKRSLDQEMREPTRHSGGELDGVFLPEPPTDTEWFGPLDMGNQVTTDSGFEFKTKLYKYILLLKSDPDPMPYLPERIVMESPDKSIKSIKDVKTYCFTRTECNDDSGGIKRTSLLHTIIGWE